MTDNVCVSPRSVKYIIASIFVSAARQYWPDRVDTLAFDCRAFQLPTKDEAANAFLWRELDATKNAISMAAQHYFSHKDLQGKSGPEMQEMLFAKGINFNDYPARFKRGTFVLRRTVFKELDAETLEKIPEGKRASGPIERQIVQTVEMPKFSTVTNRVGVLFDNAEPDAATPSPPAAPRTAPRQGR